MAADPNVLNLPTDVFPLSPPLGDIAEALPRTIWWSHVSQTLRKGDISLAGSFSAVHRGWVRHPVLSSTPCRRSQMSSPSEPPQDLGLVVNLYHLMNSFKVHEKHFWKEVWAPSERGSLDFKWVFYVLFCCNRMLLTIAHMVSINMTCNVKKIYIYKI